jgi:hypothetical protein
VTTESDRIADCCLTPHLKEIQHPIYRCQNCKKKVKLVKIERIVARVIRESQDSGATK